MPLRAVDGVGGIGGGAGGRHGENLRFCGRKDLFDSANFTLLCSAIYCRPVNRKGSASHGFHALETWVAAQQTAWCGPALSTRKIIVAIELTIVPTYVT